MCFLFGEVSSSSGCLGWATLLWHSLSLPYIFFEELEFPMLHAKFKFQDHRTSGSGEGDF